MIDCFLSFNNKVTNSIFFLLGDGEDKEKVSTYITDIILKRKCFNWIIIYIKRLHAI